MADIPSSQSNSGAFVPTTNIWDVGRLYEVDVQSPEFKELLVRLYQNINNIALALNIKDSGYYDLQEFVNGQLFFPATLTLETNNYRQVYRTVINFGALPNTTTKSVAHNIGISTSIPSTYSFTRIYGAASTTSQTSFIPIPYSSVSSLTENIELQVTATDVVIITNSDYSGYETCYVILEYLKY